MEFEEETKKVEPQQVVNLFEENRRDLMRTAEQYRNNQLSRDQAMDSFRTTLELMTQDLFNNGGANMTAKTEIKLNEDQKNYLKLFAGFLMIWIVWVTWTVFSILH